MKRIVAAFSADILNFDNECGSSLSRGIDRPDQNAFLLKIFFSYYVKENLIKICIYIVG